MAKIKKIPAIRFNEFQEVWEEESLGYIVEFSRGKGLSWADIDVNGSYECVLYGHLYTDYGMVIDTVKHRTNRNTNNLVKSKYGDVLIPCSDTTPTGLARATSIEKSDVFLGGDINILRPKSSLVGSFLSYNINTNRSKLIKLIKGTTVRHLDNADLKTVEVFIPPNENEQLKISSFFQSLDKLISLHQAKINKLVNLKKAMLEKMFPKQGADVPEIRFKGFEGAWGEKELGVITNITIGEFVIKTRQNPNSPYPVFNGGKSYTGFYDEYNNEGNKIIISARGANAGYVNFTKSRFWAGNSCYSVDILDKEHFSVEYFYYYIKCNQNRFIDNQQAANIPSVSKSDVEKFIIAHPQLKEQKTIAKYFQNLDKLITLHQSELDKLKNLKKACLEKMFV